MTTLRGSVPFVVSYRKVSKRPKVKRSRKFVGIRQVFRNIGGLLLNTVEDIAYETESEIVDAGKTKVVHWAVNVDDPWGINNTATMVATRLPDKPACGMHYEIVMLDESLEFPEEPVNGGEARRPPNHQAALERMRESLAREGHYDSEAGIPPA